MVDLNWLDDFINSIPKSKKGRKNIIDIAGYPKWENVNSNLLAFYFDKNEEHNFDSLFIDSLLEIINYKSENKFEIEGEFETIREVRTNKGNWIDLVISHTSEEIDVDSKTEWAIIIENKVNHKLDNDLGDYWNSTIANNKTGVVLSKHKKDLSDYNNNGIFYQSITHLELINKVQENLSQYFINSDDRHLLFLKEFIVNTQNFYKTNSMEYEAILRAFHNKSSEIEEFKKHDKELLRFLTELVVSLFEEKGYEPKHKNTATGKHFYQKDNPSKYNLRFYVDIDFLRYNNTFRSYYELYGDDTKYGSDLKSKLEEKNIFTQHNVTIGGGGGDNKGFNHIYVLHIDINTNPGKSYKENLRDTLEEHFWNHENEFVKVTEATLNEIIKQAN